MMCSAVDELGVHKFRAKILETNVASLQLFKDKLKFQQVVFFISCTYLARRLYVVKPYCCWMGFIFTWPVKCYSYCIVHENSILL